MSAPVRRLSAGVIQYESAQLTWSPPLPFAAQLYESVLTQIEERLTLGANGKGAGRGRGDKAPGQARWEALDD